MPNTLKEDMPIEYNDFKPIIFNGHSSSYYVDRNGRIASGYFTNRMHKLMTYAYPKGIMAPRCLLRVDGQNGKRISKNFPVDRLVAHAFVPNPHHYQYLIHLNYDLNNVHAYNLCWVDKDTWKSHINETKYRLRKRGTSRLLKEYNVYITAEGKVRSLRLDKDANLHQYKHQLRNAVILTTKGKRSFVPVAYLVARAFLNNPKHYQHVKHLNHNIYDDRAKNLAWCDYNDMIINDFYLGRRIFQGFRLIWINGQYINYVINAEGRLRSLFSGKEYRGVQDYEKHYFKITINGHQYRRTGKFLWERSIPLNKGQDSY